MWSLTVTTRAGFCHMDVLRWQIMWNCGAPACFGPAQCAALACCALSQHCSPGRCRPICLKHTKLSLWSMESQLTRTSINMLSMPHHTAKLTLGESGTQTALHLLGQRIWLGNWDILVSCIHGLGFKMFPTPSQKIQTPVSLQRLKKSSKETLFAFENLGFTKASKTHLLLQHPRLPQLQKTSNFLWHRIYSIAELTRTMR